VLSWQARPRRSQSALEQQQAAREAAGQRPPEDRRHCRRDHALSRALVNDCGRSTTKGPGGDMRRLAATPGPACPDRAGRRPSVRFVWAGVPDGHLWRSGSSGCQAVVAITRARVAAARCALATTCCPMGSAMSTSLGSATSSGDSHDNLTQPAGVKRSTGSIPNPPRQVPEVPSGSPPTPQCLVAPFCKCYGQCPERSFMIWAPVTGDG